MNTKSTDQVSSSRATKEAALPDWLEVVRSQVESLKFGTVQITVHDSKVVQIERVERTRLERPH